MTMLKFTILGVILVAVSAIDPPSDAVESFVTRETIAGGTVILPSNPFWKQSVRMFVDLFNNRKPMLVVYATNANCVAEAVKFARQWNVTTSVRSGGNSNLGWGTCDGCIVIDVSLMTTLDADLSTMTVTAGPGVNNRMVVDKIARLGIALPQGDCPMVNMGGYAVGGGLSLSARAIGYNIDALVECQVVDAQGDIVKANNETNADLFWALRGGSGINFGIVTQLTYKGTPLPEKMIGGYVSFPVTEAACVGNVYYNTIWGAGDPPESHPFGFSLVWLTNPATGMKNELRLYGLWYASNTDYGMEVLKPFLSCNHTANTLATGTFTDLMQPAMNQYLGFRGLNWTMPDAMIRIPSSSADFANYLTAVSNQTLQMPQGAMIAWVFAPAGGIANSFPRNHTAFPHRTTAGNFHMPTIWLTPTFEQAVRAYGQNSHAAVKPWWFKPVSNPTGGDPTSYVNHPSEYLNDYPTAYWDTNLPRLQAIKRKYDPDNFLHNGQGIL